jgi:hypothetical protein
LNRFGYFVQQGIWKDNVRVDLKNFRRLFWYFGTSHIDITVFEKNWWGPEFVLGKSSVSLEDVVAKMYSKFLNTLRFFGRSLDQDVTM